MRKPKGDVALSDSTDRLEVTFKSSNIADYMRKPTAAGRRNTVALFVRLAPLMLMPGSTDAPLFNSADITTFFENVEDLFKDYYDLSKLPDRKKIRKTIKYCVPTLRS